MKQLQIIGNLGNTPKERTTADGKEMVSFSVAVSNRDKSTTWVNCLMKKQESLLQWLTKGRQVFVQGAFDCKIYNNAIDITLFVDMLQLCGKQQEENQQPQAPTPQTAQDMVF